MDEEEVTDISNKIVGFESLVNLKRQRIVSLFSSVVELELDDQRLIQCFINLACGKLDGLELIEFLELIALSLSDEDMKELVQKIKDEFNISPLSQGKLTINNYIGYKIIECLISALHGDITSFGY
jgi:hypothetical protein